MLRKILVLVLAALATIVLTCLICNVYPWGWIIAYWIVLAVKNIMDYYYMDIGR